MRNKARLVAKGYILEEGINSDEAFATIVRLEIEYLRLYLTYALSSFKWISNLLS